MIEYNPKSILEARFAHPVSALAEWLDQIDKLGKFVPKQDLTDYPPKSHPLESQSYPFIDHQTNLQLAGIAIDLIADQRYFSPVRVQELMKKIQSVDLSSGEPIWDLSVSPHGMVYNLIQKQHQYLKVGQSWQFAKVGLEVNLQAQRVAYKLHALQELLEPYTGSGAREYEDQLSDIFTIAIMDRADQLKTLGSLIGPYRFSVRWEDFLTGEGKPTLRKWISNAQFFGKRGEIPDILLSIVTADSAVIPGSVVQLLEKYTIRSTGKLPPLRPKDVADPHYHSEKVELCLPLMGPAVLKVQFSGKGRIHSFTPDPNTNLDLDLSQIGALMTKGIPTLVYKAKFYQPHDKNGRFINVLLENGSPIQFIVIRPGDIHDFTNVGITPASAFALSLGFPLHTGDSLDGDFVEIEDKQMLFV